MSERARQLVAAAIRGDLDVCHVESVVRLRFAASFLELPRSPVTSVESVSVGPVTVQASEYEVTRFGLQKADGWWPTDCPIRVSYTTGWADGEEPITIKQALEMTESWLLTEPESGVRSYSEGGVSVSRDAVDGIPKLARDLITTWVRP